MPCFHKFYGHANHMNGAYGLLPNWDANTLIIGTFNPEDTWAPNNLANYFYGRLTNYFWSILPKFVCEQAIDQQDIPTQINFLQRNRIALTDLLISINDANNPDHINWITNFRDNNLNLFNDLQWNTQNILDYIIDKNIIAVYFTRIGDQEPFGQQISIIEDFCDRNRIINFRLHTPSGQGLGPGTPRRNKLIHTWYHQGGNHFPFLCPDFNIDDPEFGWNI